MHSSLTPALQLWAIIALLVTSSTTLAHDAVVSPTHIETGMDKVPRFCADPDVTAITDGNWSNAATWSTSAVPSDGDRVTIANDVVVTYDALATATIDCIEIGDRGALRWAVDQDTHLNIINLQVLPGGQLEIGTSQTPIAAERTAEIVFADVPLEVNGRDPAQYGNGLHVFGEVTMHGALRSPTFVRFAAEPSSGETTLALGQSPSNWRSGDRLLIPDTRQIPFRKNRVFESQAELPTLQTVGQGTVSLEQPLAFDHHGPRDATGNVGETERAMLPHVGNLTRNIILRSVALDETSKDRYCRGVENLDDTDACVTLGHMMAHGKAAVDLRYAAFRHLGRTLVDSLDNSQLNTDGSASSIGTNQIGRYSVHLHHMRGPENPTNSGYQYRFQGNVIEGFLKWGLTVHNTHYGLVADNILYDGEGSAVATEAGNEAFNVFERNFIVHTKAGDSEQIIENPGRAGVTSGRRTNFGFTRDGFWFSGMYNYVRDNVVANAPGFAYNYNGYYLTQQQPIPDFRGADMATDATVLTAPPVLESVRNEAYGATGQGLWLTWSRGCCRVETYTDVSLFKDYRIWHVNNAGVETYHESRSTFDGFVLRNDPEVSAQSEGGSVRFNSGFDFANRFYENGQMVLRDIDVQGFNIGVRMPHRPEDRTEEPNVFTLQDSLLRNHVNLQELLPLIDRKTATIRNVQFLSLDLGAIPSQPEQPTAIHMDYTLSKHSKFPDRHNTTLVQNFNGVSGDDLELYFEEQAPDFPIPPPPDFNNHPNFEGCPEPNLTNQQCWDRHRVAVGGRIAPCVAYDGDASCDAARARAAEYGILGLAFPIRTLFSDGFE